MGRQGFYVWNAKLLCTIYGVRGNCSTSHKQQWIRTIFSYMKFLQVRPCYSYPFQNIDITHYFPVNVVVIWKILAYSGGTFLLTKSLIPVPKAKQSFKKCWKPWHSYATFFRFHLRYSSVHLFHIVDVKSGFCSAVMG